MRKYDHKKIEQKWQKRWSQSEIYKTEESSDKPKCYILDMFPYPSGEGLHVGHVEGQTATDIYSRYMRMRGYNVLHPMGWDAFGLPAENYAIKTGVHPKETTARAINNFREQIKNLGFSYDWSREINTSSPDYYKWTQWLFLLLYKNGYAYKKNAPVNWDPVDQTVLANEQVLPDGTADRSGAKVIKKDLEQWFFKITDFADALFDDLDLVDWPESTVNAQRNWIGRSKGAKISFETDAKFHYVLLHGYKSSPDLNFHPWLKNELEKRGHTVEVPALPNSNDPNIEEQVQFVLENVRFTEKTILIGHSLGSVVALKALERSGTSIQKLVLVAGFQDSDIKVERGNRNYFKSFDWVFDFEKLRRLSRQIVILRDVQDEVVPSSQADKLQRSLGGQIVDFQAVLSHAVAKEEPEVLRAALENIEVFTTRPDTLFGATYVVLAPEHGLLKSFEPFISNQKEVLEYIERARQKTDIERTAEGKEKTGVEIQGIKAVNPASQKEMSIFVADYILFEYGTGAIMAVPAHDERDFDFANKFNLPIKKVVSATNEGLDFEKPYVGFGNLINSGKFDNLPSAEAKLKIVEEVGGKLQTTYKIRDWLISRQRYWGTPIPIVYDPEGNPHPIPDEHLPWLLPTDVSFEPKGMSPLAKSKELLQRTERIFGSGWRPEVDTMDTFVDSSWYFLRFIDPQNNRFFADAEKMKKWFPVDLYVGGAEHTVLHLLYARFFTKALSKLDYLNGQEEPFQALRHPGMILGADGNKMSKSKGNIVNPNDAVETFGADTIRLYEMFMGPFEQGTKWNTDNVIGPRRFLEKVWSLMLDMNKKGFVKETSSTNKSLLEETIEKVSQDIENCNFNTAVSSMMILINSWWKERQFSRLDGERFVKMLAPFAPHISEELWEVFGNNKSIHLDKFPEPDRSYLKKSKITIVVQVNGKTRSSFEGEASTSEEQAKRQALALPDVQKWMEGGEPCRVIYVPGKLINLVK